MAWAAKLRNMKIYYKLSLVFVVVLLLSACNHNQQEGSITDLSKSSRPSADVLDGHMGCQEGEIASDGICTAAEKNNAMIFGQDLSEKVRVEDIVTTETRGYLARPKEEGEYPGVVMIHEWWGLNDNIKEMARILASEGYIVFAVDLYGGEVATESSEAIVLATTARENQEQSIASMQAAADYLRAELGASKIASLGWCFGGQHSLLLSLNDDIAATVIYYGQVSDDRDQLANISGPVLGIFGAEDSSIPLEGVERFDQALDGLEIENEIKVYDGVGHAFANPSGTNYAPEETKDAWQKTLSFLDESL